MNFQRAALSIDLIATGAYFEHNFFFKFARPLSAAGIQGIFRG